MGHIRPIGTFMTSHSKSKGNNMDLPPSCDYAPMCKAKSTQKHAVEFASKKLDWPAQIPDLNTIKHIWDQF